MSGVAVCSAVLAACSAMLLSPGASAAPSSSFTPRKTIASPWGPLIPTTRARPVVCEAIADSTSLLSSITEALPDDIPPDNPPGTVVALPQDAPYSYLFTYKINGVELSGGAAVASRDGSLVSGSAVTEAGPVRIPMSCNALDRVNFRITITRGDRWGRVFPVLDLDGVAAIGGDLVGIASPTGDGSFSAYARFGGLRVQSRML
jgi:hypothetical protein